MYKILSLLIILYGKGLVKGYSIVIFLPKVLQRKILEFKLCIGKAVGGVCDTCAMGLNGSLILCWGLRATACRYPPPNSLKVEGGVDLSSTGDLASEVDAQHDRNKHQQGSEDEESFIA